MLLDMNISEVAPGLYLVPVPIPVPLKYVNCYAARGQSGWTLVDTGFHDPGAETAWQEAFRQLGFGPRDVERVVVTHYHPDHYGAAGWLQQLSGAPVLMLDREAAMTEIMWDPALRQGAELAAFFRRSGMPEPLTREMDWYQGKLQALVSPRPSVTTVREGDRIPIGDRLFEVVWAPGHSDGLMVLWNEEERILLADDMVLVKITPNVSLWPRMNPDPLGSFLGSLEKVGRLPAVLTLTGHRDPVYDLAGRCAELARHHDERLKAAVELAGDGATAWEVSLGLFGEQDNIHNARFAVAEALSHLEYLYRRGFLARDEDGGVVRYRRSGPRRTVSVGP